MHTFARRFRRIQSTQMEQVGDWLISNRRLLMEATGVLFVLLVLQRAIGRLRRHRGPATLHPNLQRYAGRSPEELETDRLAAAGIVATSSTPRVAGYEIVRQIEAVFVEGYRASEESVTALKAAAGRLGANAIINLSQQRTAAGRCTAQGDAVQVRPRAPSGPERGAGTPTGRPAGQESSGG